MRVVWVELCSTCVQNIIFRLICIKPKQKQKALQKVDRHITARTGCLKSKKAQKPTTTTPKCMKMYLE